MRTKFKAWAEPYINEHPEVMVKGEEISSFPHPYFLEIGSGKGQFLVNMALKNPSLYFVGVERNVTCSGFTAKKLVESELTNAKLIFDNVERIFPYIKDESVESIFLNFSDPWPKRRHNKRRLTADAFLSEYYRILKKDGKIYIKTDNDDLFAYSVENFENSKFKILSNVYDYQDIEEFDQITEYEQSFRDEGTKIHRLVVQK